MADALPDWIRERAGERRYLFGIAGAPGSGKSTLAANLAAALNARQGVPSGGAAAVVAPMDGFHRTNAELDALGLRHVKGSPSTFDAEAFVEGVRTMRTGDDDVWLADFDRTIDEPRPNRIEIPAAVPIVIVEGNYLLLDTAPWNLLPPLFDALAFLEVDNDLRRQRLVARHVSFGRSEEEAIAFVERSDEPNARLIEASRHRASLTVLAV